MENQPITSVRMQQSSIPFGTEIEPLLKSENSELLHLERSQFEDHIQKASKAMKRMGRNKQRKAEILTMLKNRYPDLDLRKFVATQCANNFDDDNFEHLENMELADHLEDHLNLKKVAKKFKKVAVAAATGGTSLLADKKVRKGIAKVGKGALKYAAPVLKVATPILGIAGSIVGTPALGAGITAGLGALSKLAKTPIGKAVAAAKDLGLDKKVMATIAKTPEKLTLAQVQAIAPATGVEKTLAPLIPFEGLMRKTLASKGTSTNERTTLEDLSGMFHQKIIQGKSNYNDNWCKNDASYYEPHEYFDNLDFSQAGKLVNDIVAFFKKSQTAPSNTTEVAIGAEVKAKQLENQKQIAEDAVKETTNKEVAVNGFSMQHVLLLVVVAIGIYVVVK